MHDADSSFIEPPPGEGEGGPAQPDAPPDLGPVLGLVNTVSRHAQVARSRSLAGLDGTPGTAEWHQAVELLFATAARLSRMRRRVLTRARVQAAEAAVALPGHTALLVTCTYAPGLEWSPRDIRCCVGRYRDQARRDGVPFRYEWVAELQTKRMRRREETARQCLHYHAMVWQPAGYSFPKPDNRGWWPHGMTQVEVARTPAAYLAKYASKGASGSEALPHGVRISGGGGLSELGRLEVAWWLRPRYVREAFPDPTHVVARQRGGGWFNLTSGTFLDAPETW